MSKKGVRILLYTILIGSPLMTLTGAVIFGALNLDTIFSSADAFREWVLGFNTWGIAVFIAAQILQVIIFIIPGEITQISGGYLFGAWQGALYSTIGITVGTMINYLIGYGLGAPFIQRLMRRDQYIRLSETLHSRPTITTLFLLFLIPGMPKDIMAYFAGGMRFHYHIFIFCSTLGRMPALVGSSMLGASLSNERWRNIVVIVTIVCALLYIIALRARFFLKRNGVVIS